MVRIIRVRPGTKPLGKNFFSSQWGRMSAQNRARYRAAGNRYIRTSISHYGASFRQPGFRKKFFWRPSSGYYRITPSLPTAGWDIPIALYQLYKLKKTGGAYPIRDLHILGIPLRTHTLLRILRRYELDQRAIKPYPLWYELIRWGKKQGVIPAFLELVRRVKEWYDGIPRGTPSRQLLDSMKPCGMIELYIYFKYRRIINICNVQRKKTSTW